MEYLDFELRIMPGAGREYPVSVLQSPAGETSATMRFPFDTLALQNQLQKVEIAVLRSGGTRRDVATDEPQVGVREFGRKLFESLMADTVRETFRRSQDRARTSGRGLRVRLRIEAPELASLPWEYLYDPAEGDFICLSTDTPVVRYLEFDRPPEALTIQPPLSILGVIASPSDRPALDVFREKQRVEAAIAGLRDAGLLKITWLGGSTWRDLQKAMRQGEYHIFHFIGHGGFDNAAGEGVVALTDDQGSASLLSATQLGRLLADHQSLRMVILNSCLGAKGSSTDVFSSTASILVRRGVSAVVAMQYEISDLAAIEFSRSLYEALADGMPVDAAVAEARKAISLSVNNTVEWGTPVLHMRSPDGKLFNIQGMTTSMARASGTYHSAPGPTVEMPTVRPLAPPTPPHSPPAEPVRHSAPTPTKVPPVKEPSVAAAKDVPRGPAKSDRSRDEPESPTSAGVGRRWRLVAGAAGGLAAVIIGYLLIARPHHTSGEHEGGPGHGNHDTGLTTVADDLKVVDPLPPENPGGGGGEPPKPAPVQVTPWNATKATVAAVRGDAENSGPWKVTLSVFYTGPKKDAETAVDCLLRLSGEETKVHFAVPLEHGRKGGDYSQLLDAREPSSTGGQVPVTCSVDGRRVFDGQAQFQRVVVGGPGFDPDSLHTRGKDNPVVVTPGRNGSSGEPNARQAGPPLAPVRTCIATYKFPTPSSDPYLYRPRESRCEGTHPKETSTTPLRVYSVTSTFEDYDPASVKSLGVDWTPVDSAVHIGVRGLRTDRSFAYRMDAVIPAGWNYYVWPTDVIAHLKLAQQDIGMIAWARGRVGNTWRNVYLPVNITTSSDRAPSQTYTVVILALRPLDSLYISYGPVDENGKHIPAKLLKDHELVSGDFYPLGRLTIPRPAEPGIYLLTMTGTERATSASPQPVPYTAAVWMNTSAP